MQSTLSGRSSRNHLYSCVFCLCQTILYFPSSFFTSSHHWNVQIKILPFHHYHHTKYISLTEVMIRDWTLIALYSINIIWCFKTYKPRILLPKKKGNSIVHRFEICIPWVRSLKTKRKFYLQVETFWIFSCYRQNRQWFNRKSWIAGEA